MKLKALSHYDNDMDTRFGDCILLYDDRSMIVYDCGHIKHAEAVKEFLREHIYITTVDIVVSHNDSDHTDGICDLLNWLHDCGTYTVKVYSHQYLKHVGTIMDKIDDKRRSPERLKEALLNEFDHIKEIIETAQKLSFPAIEALCGTTIGSCTIVGPTVDAFTDVAAKAMDKRENNTIGEGPAQETVMNAASVQLKGKLSDGKYILLCGDASPDYINDINSYQYIQLPHHGQEDDAKAIFEKLGANSYRKEYLISDNSGSAKTSGGSENLETYMKKEKYSLTLVYNTKKQVIELPASANVQIKEKGRKYLGDMGSI